MDTKNGPQDIVPDCFPSSTPYEWKSERKKRGHHLGARSFFECAPKCILRKSSDNWPRKLVMKSRLRLSDLEHQDPQGSGLFPVTAYQAISLCQESRVIGKFCPLDMVKLYRSLLSQSVEYFSMAILTS
jgi:hypothetical protein